MGKARSHVNPKEKKKRAKNTHHSSHWCPPGCLYLINMVNFVSSRQSKLRHFLQNHDRAIWRVSFVDPDKIPFYAHPDDDIADPISFSLSSFSDSLVKVRAQVMTRDESTEGWLPLQGGGLANVSIRKRARMPDVGGHEYIIYGQRISDQTVNSINLCGELDVRLFAMHFRSFSVAS